MRPITPQPGYTVEDVEALLASRQYAYADCYTLTPRYGDPVYITTRDKPVSVTVDGSPRTYQSDGVFTLEGIKLSLSVGVDIDEQEIKLMFSSTKELWGLPIRQAIRYGRFDGSRITRERYFAAGPRQPWLGSILLFLGRTAHADRITPTEATIAVKSELILLSTKVPRDLYQPGCNNVLYDERCGLDRELFKTTSLTESGTTASTIVSADATADMALGVLYIDNPDGITLIRTIKSVSGSNINLAYPLDFVPAVGVSFDAYEGCNRTRARCTEFSNISRYRGYPYVPVAETAI